MKHDNPIIVDIIDEHEIFRNQASKRRSFYKKSNYRIREIHSPQYRGMNIDWNGGGNGGDKTWRRTFEPSVMTMEDNRGEEEEEKRAKKCLIPIMNFCQEDDSPNK
jgi:hypothetical protein